MLSKLTEYPAKYLKTLVAAPLLTVYFLCACNPQSGSSPTSALFPVSGGNTNPSANGNTGAGAGTGGSKTKAGITGDGTSTSGGGSGIDGKNWDAYLVNPLELKAYKEVLAPIFEKIKSTAAQKTEKTKDHKLTDFFGWKTWYIAPVDLETINKDLLGISFVKSQIQQIARQTLRAVWIDKRIFESNSMTTADQAALILHEYVMGLYQLKFLKMDELCKLSAAFDPQQKLADCATFAKVFNMEPESFHELNDADNQNINDVTNWLLHLDHDIPETEFARFLYIKNFDKRLFNPKHYDPKGSEQFIKLSAQELRDSILNAGTAGFVLDSCRKAHDLSSLPCLINLSSGIQTISVKSHVGNDVIEQNLETAQIKVSVTLPNTSQIVGFSIPAFFDEATLSENESMDGNTYLSFTFIEMKQQLASGDQYYWGEVLFKKPSSKNGALELVGIIVRPAIVISVDPKHDPKCKVVSPNPTSAQTTGFVLGRAGVNLPLDIAFTLRMDPWASCGMDAYPTSAQ